MLKVILIYGLQEVILSHNKKILIEWVCKAYMYWYKSLIMYQQKKASYDSYHTPPRRFSTAELVYFLELPNKSIKLHCYICPIYHYNMTQTTGAWLFSSVSNTRKRKLWHTCAYHVTCETGPCSNITDSATLHCPKLSRTCVIVKTKCKLLIEQIVGATWLKRTSRDDRYKTHCLIWPENMTAWLFGEVDMSAKYCEYTISKLKRQCQLSTQIKLYFGISQFSMAWYNLFFSFLHWHILNS